VFRAPSCVPQAFRVRSGNKKPARAKSGRPALGSNDKDWRQMSEA
jgi:hypothetical protein